MIQAWLHGKIHKPSEHLSISYQGLSFLDGDGGSSAIGIFISKSDRSLQAMVMDGALGTHSWRAIEFIVRLMGLPDRLERVRVGAVTEPQWEFNGTVLTKGQPFVLAGAISLLAYRATPMLSAEELEEV